jgi:NAD-dependent oxidoreductase involved in siderophore biosynthesis
MRPAFIRTVIPVWLITAAWDFLCATALSVFAYHATAAHLWQGVASTVLGPSAIDGGASAVAAGIALHLAVAFAWSAVFVAAARMSSIIRRVIASPSGALAVAIAYGPIIWLVMSLVIIPFATGRPPRLGFRWWVQIFAHIPFVTIPLVFTARRVLLGAGAIPATVHSVESTA